MTVTEYPTFSDSPFFYDRRSASLPEHDLSTVQGHSPRRVAYYHPKDVGNYHYGEKHPMRPHRLELTNQLVLAYGLHNRMSMHSPRKATEEELLAVHDQDYLAFLKRATPGKSNDKLSEQERSFQIGEDSDCPWFEGMFDFCQQYAGASLAAARKLASESADIAINWSGGLHHAKRRQASGFCYVNDIVLAILQLLRTQPRVLYIDIDVHHGDGVQHAFYQSDRVMTVSFHKYTWWFFPGQGIGAIDHTGVDQGKHFCLNVPLKDGIDDESYISLFKSIMEPTINTFRPTSIVLQCGADSLGLDRLGSFNLSIAAHGECVRYIKSFNLPVLVLGGGGYRISSVARCWTYETGIMTGVVLPEELPQNKYYEFYGPDYSLHPPLMSEIPNENSRTQLERIRRVACEQIRWMQGAPSVQMQEIPPDLMGFMEDEERTVEEKREEEMGAEGSEIRRDSKLKDGDLLEAERVRAGKTCFMF